MTNTAPYPLIIKLVEYVLFLIQLFFPEQHIVGFIYSCLEIWLFVVVANSLVIYGFQSQL